MPVHSGSCRQAKGRDHAIGAIGVIERFRIGLVEPLALWFSCHRHDFDPEQMPGIPEEAPADGTDPAGSTGDEAADGGAAPGAGKQPQFPSMAAQELIEIPHQTTGLHGDNTRGRVKRLDGAQIRGHHDHATLQGNALPVISTPGSPEGEGQVELGTGTNNPCNALQIMGSDHHIGMSTTELLRQNRGVIKEIP